MHKKGLMRMTADSWAAIENDVQERIRQGVRQCKTRGQQAAFRSAVQLRNSALKILGGQRGGRVYTKPNSSSTYTASAPGSPPAVRTGMLRMSWSPSASGSSGAYKATITSGAHYAGYLEDGTSKMAARPFKQKIIDDAKPKIEQICQSVIAS